MNPHCGAAIRTAGVVMILMCSGIGWPPLAQAQYDPNAAEPVAKLRGALLLHGGGRIGEAVRSRFLELAGGKSARLVVIPTADPDDPLGDDHLDLWRSLEPESIVRLHAETREQAVDPEFSTPLGTATGVWISGGRQSRLAQTYVDTPVVNSLQAIIHRGGIVGGSSAGAAIASQIMLLRDEVRTGFDLLPGSIIDQHFLARKRHDRLLRAVETARQRVGLGIDEDTALIVKGRQLEVVGSSTVTVCLPASEHRPARTIELSTGTPADYIALARAAQARGAASFPLEQTLPPRVDSGALVIVGGGGIPAGLLERFIELAGGQDAPLVYVPCEEQEVIATEPAFVEQLRRSGAKNVTWIHTKDRKQASHDQQFLTPLKAARGIWFGGGRQWNLVDSYQNTTAHKLMHDVLSRGGVIGGSSAGASIQGDYMPRGDPLGNINIIAEGYERGLGFLTGVAIDQHFAQRNRFADMSELTREFPQLLGIGLDESTAIVVPKEIAEVLGAGNVAFYDARTPREPDKLDYLSLGAGRSYDLVARREIERPVPPNPQDGDPQP